MNTRFFVFGCIVGAGVAYLLARAAQVPEIPAICLAGVACLIEIASCLAISPRRQA
jgi:hypothetical protein